FHVRFVRWAAISVPDELPEQTLGISHRLFGNHLHTRRRLEAALTESVRFAGILVNFRRRAIHHRQIAEEQLVSRGRPLVIDRAFDFEPAENHAGLAILFREWILPAGRARPGPEPP